MIRMFLGILEIILIVMAAFLFIAMNVSFAVEVYFSRKEKFVLNIIKIAGEAASKILEKSKENKDGNC